MYDIPSYGRFSPYGDNAPNAPTLLELLNQKVDYLQRKLDEMEAKLNRVQVSLHGWDTWYYDGTHGATPWGWLLWKIRHWWLGTSSTDTDVDDKEVTMSTEMSETGDP